jgi:hypothetical protein
MRQAVETFTACGAAAQAARTRLALAEVRAEQGAKDDARREVGAAREAFVHMGAPRLIERADRLAERLGLARG